MALDVKPKWKETELLWKSKRDYVQEKAADYAARKKGRPDANDWKARRDHDQRNGHRNRGGYNRGGGRNRGNRDRGSRGGRSGRDRYFQGESYHEQ
jgi:lupus La protein